MAGFLTQFSRDLRDDYEIRKDDSFLMQYLRQERAGEGGKKPGGTAARLEAAYAGATDGAGRRAYLLEALSVLEKSNKPLLQKAPEPGRQPAPIAKERLLSFAESTGSPALTGAARWDRKICRALLAHLRVHEASAPDAALIDTLHAELQQSLLRREAEDYLYNLESGRKQSRDLLILEAYLDRHYNRYDAGDGWDGGGSGDGEAHGNTAGGGNTGGSRNGGGIEAHGNTEGGGSTGSARGSRNGGDGEAHGNIEGGGGGGSAGNAGGNRNGGGIEAHKNIEGGGIKTCAELGAYYVKSGAGTHRHAWTGEALEQAQRFFEALQNQEYEYIWMPVEIDPRTGAGVYFIGMGRLLQVEIGQKSSTDHCRIARLYLQELDPQADEYGNTVLPMWVGSREELEELCDYPNVKECLTWHWRLLEAGDAQSPLSEFQNGNGSPPPECPPEFLCYFTAPAAYEPPDLDAARQDGRNSFAREKTPLRR